MAKAEGLGGDKGGGGNIDVGGEGSGGARVCTQSASSVTEEVFGEIQPAWKPSVTENTLYTLTRSHYPQ